MRKTIGRLGELTPDEARKRAAKLLLAMSDGHDPTAARRTKRDQLPTLEEMFDAYLTARELKATTQRDYRRHLKTTFSKWRTLRLDEITADDVQQRFQDVSKRSKAQANQAFRYLSAVYNFAIAQHESLDSTGKSIANPIDRLRKLKLWHRTRRKDSYVSQAQLADWWGALHDIDAALYPREAESYRDLCKLNILTGLRRSEATQLRWEHIDLKAKTLTVPDTKNGTPLTLPISDYLAGVLEARRKAVDGDLVFPNRAGTGPMTEVRHHQSRIAKICGVRTSMHDLRRSFASYAQDVGLTHYDIKKLLNHRNGNDVTAGYIIRSVEHLRPLANKLAAYVLKLAGEVADLEPPKPLSDQITFSTTFTLGPTQLGTWNVLPQSDSVLRH